MTTRERIQVHELAPDAVRGVLAVEKVVAGALDHRLLDVVKLRASIVNGCAYCVDLHTTDLLRRGEDPRRLAAVAAWRESPFFDDTERAVLGLTDAVTRLGVDGVPDDVWSAATALLDDAVVAHLVVGIGLINLGNRIAVTSHKQPPALTGRGA